MSKAPVIAVDFDNTIVNYDDVFHGLAVERRLIDETVGKSKVAVREHVRGLPDGERHWRKLQAAAYGSEMWRAQPTNGVQAFFTACSGHRCQVYVVSHKTMYADQDDRRFNLRSAAMDWMVSNNFFKPEGLGLDRTHVFFEETRIDKLNRVKSLGCSHLIDDLEETFLEEGVASTIDKILYAPHGSQLDMPGVTRASNWQEITDYVFNDIG